MEKFSYDKIKDWAVDHKLQINIILGFLVVFMLGFGSGRAEKKYHNSNKNDLSKQNYTTKTVAEPVKTDVKEADNPIAQTKPQEATSLDPATCTKIKGNIGSGGLIYHIPGGSSYKIVKAEKCFNTEDEAKTAGFRKASR